MKIETRERLERWKQTVLMLTVWIVVPLFCWWVLYQLVF